MKTLPAFYRRFALAVLFTASFSVAKAQYVTIPDTAFMSFLWNNFPACMNSTQGNLMDTTCPAIINARKLRLINMDIKNFEGIQYFDGLDTLDARGNLGLVSLPALPPSLVYLSINRAPLTSLPPLPSTLKHFDCDQIAMTALPALPNGLEILTCRFNNLTALPPLPDFLSYLECTNNQLTSLAALPDSMKYLNCSDNPLSSLPTLPPNLENLGCVNGQLTSLPALPSKLKFLNCTGNQLTSLPPLPTTNFQALECGQNQLTSLPALPHNGVFVHLDCSNNPITTLPPLPSSVLDLFCANTLITGLPELPPNLWNLDVSSTPNMHCLPELRFVMHMFQFDTSAIRCLPNYPDAQISVPPLSSVPVCDPFNQHGCPVFWNISGKTFYEANANCQQDVAELNLPNVKINLYQNGALVQQTYTDSAGAYSFNTQLGTYTATADTAALPFDIHCPASRFDTSVISANDSTENDAHFALKCKGGYDVGAWSIAAPFQFFPARLGTVGIHAGDVAEVWNQNCNTAGVSGQLVTTITGPVTFSAVPPGALTPNHTSGNTLTYNINDWQAVNPGRSFNIIVQTDTTAQAAQQVCITVALTPTGDNNSANNTLTNCFTVVNSFDPNDKQVSPAGNIDTTQEWLTYTVRFQNTGTAAAQHIYVDDTLDTDLDESTFQLLTYSHQPLTQIDGNTVRFNFPNINLPDSTSDEPGSHGYVQYKIRLKENLPIGTTIENTAAIYFDFNPPVITNTTVNTIAVLIPPVASITPASFDLCNGESVTLTASGGVSYQWNNGSNGANLTATPSSTTTYSITVTDQHGSTATTSSTVNVNDLPQPAITQNAHMLITGAYSSYQWLLDGSAINNATSQELHITQNGNYTVIVTDANGCTGTSAVKNVTGVGIGGIDDSGMMLYPNPNNGNFVLDFSDNATKEVMITDLVGKVIAPFEVVNKRKEFRLNHLAKGIYFLRVKKGEQMINVKFEVN